MNNLFIILISLTVVLVILYYIRERIENNIKRFESAVRRNVKFNKFFSNEGKPFLMSRKPGRNEICPYCESGIKYKYCCESKRRNRMFLKP